MENILKIDTNEERNDMSIDEDTFEEPNVEFSQG